jgi:hypothetical protein
MHVLRCLRRGRPPQRLSQLRRRLSDAADPAGARLAPGDRSRQRSPWLPATALLLHTRRDRRVHRNLVRHPAPGALDAPHPRDTVTMIVHPEIHRELAGSARRCSWQKPGPFEPDCPLPHDCGCSLFPASARGAKPRASSVHKRGAAPGVSARGARGCGDAQTGSPGRDSSMDTKPPQHETELMHPTRIAPSDPDRPNSRSDGRGRLRARSAVATNSAV